MNTAISAEEYQRRRRQLMKRMGRNSIAIIPAAPERTRSRDTEHRYRQDSDFFYLCGFTEPEAILVLMPGRDEGEFLVFCRERDALMETWHGRRLGVERASGTLGADAAYPIAAADQQLPDLIEGCERIYYSLGTQIDFDQRVMGWLNQVRVRPRGRASTAAAFVALDYHLHEMRLFKSRAELAVMRRAAAVSAAGHVAAMQGCRPGRREYQLEADLSHTYTAAGGTHAFLPIVGGGENGCILHYTENRDELANGSLVLVDSGAEIDGYAGDITRTYPVNGRFTGPQRELYEVVLAANLAAIDAVRPGNHWNMPHEAAVKVLVKGLIRLGLLKGTPAKAIKDESYRRFFMHRTGHWLGLDVHDVGAYKQGEKWRLLEPGMVLTIEPGLYIAAGRGVPKRYANIGIRIEDDVVVTRKGCEILTADVPKHADAIETLMAAAHADD